MAGRRTRPTEPVTIELDGKRLEAQAGEPVVAALVAAGKLAIARSPKFHRPRGPACLRAACDGCLARVDDVPNMMTCMVAAREGMVVRTQNTLGGRETDLLRMTDWFFPKGLNHHEIFAGVPGLQGLMQGFARRVAGLGRIPGRTAAAREARRREADVVVVGSGAAGMSIASLAAERGRAVTVVDDALGPGGSLVGFTGQDWAPLFASFDEAVVRGAISLHLSTTAAAFYGDDLLVVGPKGAEILTARTFILAPGAHDGVLAFEGNDVPGVMSARAGLALVARGVLPGDRVVVVITEGGGPFGEVFARAMPQATVVRGEPVRVRGSLRVREVTVREGARTRLLAADALLIDAPRAPAYELPAQAGAALEHLPRGFLAKTDRGQIRNGVWLAGEAAGTPLDAAAMAEEARAIAAQL
jgi:sarcosine oxidase subunit alpha